MLSTIGKYRDDQEGSIEALSEKGLRKAHPGTGGEKQTIMTIVVAPATLRITIIVRIRTDARPCVQGPIGQAISCRHNHFPRMVIGPLLLVSSALSHAVGSTLSSIELSTIPRLLSSRFGR